MCHRSQISINALKSKFLSSPSATKIFACYRDPAATLDDLHEAVSMFEETERTARRVLGGAHPITDGMVKELRIARLVLRARETRSPGRP